MPQLQLPLPLVLAGPTGIGKTALAVELALRLPFELVSADSMQVYRGLEIGTAQPTTEELRGLPIHGCGMLAPADPFSVKHFVDLCDAAHAEITARGKVPLYVGGTGMYLRALRWGLLDQPDLEPGASATIRARLEREIAKLGPEPLHARLQQVDPVQAARIAPRDGIRIVRALEVAEATGRPLSELQAQWAMPEARFPHILVVLHAPRPVVIERIERRVDAMLQAGWIEEVQRLLDAGCPPDLHCFKALGYREIIGHLAGRMDRAKLVEVIKARTRQFSRRQMIWLRKERDAHWVELDPETPSHAIAQIESLLSKVPKEAEP